VGGQGYAPATLPPGKRLDAHCGPSAFLDGCGKSSSDSDSIPKPSSPTTLSRPTYICFRQVIGWRWTLL